MKTKIYTAAVMCLAASGPAFADFIVDPAQSGLNAVSITGVYRNPTTGRYAITGPVFDANGSQLAIGGFGSVPGGVASLTINNQTGDYDVFGLTNLGLSYVGKQSAGELTVDGTGAFIEADTTWFGVGNSAEINILNGGRYSGERTFVALDYANGTPPGDVTVRVDGVGSTLETETIDIGSSSIPTAASGKVIVSNGGLLSAAPTPGENYSYGQIYVGADSHTADDSLVVTGAGSRAEAVDFIGVISLAGSDRIDVLDGGVLASGDRIAVGGYENTAELLVSGAGSLASAAGDVIAGLTRFVGFDDPVNYTGAQYGLHDALITVENGGTLTATGDVILDAPVTFDTSGGTVLGDPVSAELVVGSGGTVNASRVVVNSGGKLSGADGLINADVVVNGGILSPGASPGIMTVDGDVDLFGAMVLFEIGGTTAGDFDQLVISGNLFADAATVFSFSLFDSFMPQAGDVFEIFDVAGGVDIGAATFDFSGFGAGISSSLFDSGNGSFALRVDSVTSGGGVSAVPLPAGGLLLISGLGILGLRRKRRKS